MHGIKYEGNLIGKLLHGERAGGHNLENRDQRVELGLIIRNVHIANIEEKLSGR